MTAILKRANDEKGYFMTDSSTWVAENKNFPNLKVLFRRRQVSGEYLSYPLPTRREYLWGHLGEFVGSEEGQGIIRDFGKQQYGEGIYTDAVYARKYDE